MFSWYYIEGILIQSCYTLLIVLGLSILTGYTGMFSFGHAGFVCIGAYVSVICTMAFGLPYWLSLILAGLVAMLLGAGLGKITLNLKGDYFCIATLGVGEAIRLIFNNLQLNINVGGKGFLLILGGMLSALRGEERPELTEENAQEKADFAMLNEEDITFTFDTVFIVRKSGRSIEPFRRFLDGIGDSLVIGEDDEAFKVHVHTDIPGEALTEAQKYGTLELAKIENMRTQAQQLAAGGKAQSTDDLEAIEQELEAAEHENAGEAEPEKDFGFLAVCAGKGLANVFTDLGADGVISGGQTMNPSTESILKEIKKVPAHTVFVLPNNKNIIMAAQQCIGLTEKTVVVIPTASIPQGVSAMMAVDPDMSDADAIAKAMTDAAQCVSTAQITYAARNSDFDGFDIHEGDYLALLDGKLLGTDRDVSALLDGLSDEAASREAEFITVFYGEDVNEEDARKACDAFTRKCPDAEVNLICGGQPVYYYIISIE